MNLGRIRMILIAALLLLNGFFAFLWHRANSEISNMPEEMIQDAVKSLRGSGVFVEKETIPAKAPNHAIYSYEVQSPSVYTEKLQSFFLPKSKLAKGEKTESAYFNIPEGFSVSFHILRGDGTSSEYAVITCAGDFGFEYRSADFDAVPAVDIHALSEQKRNAVPGAKIKKTVARFFAVFENNYKKMEYQIVYASRSALGDAVLCRQTLDGTTLDGMTLYFQFDEKGALLFITGKWCFEGFEKKYSDPLIDGINILYQLTDKGDIRVIDQEIIYMPVKYDAEKYYSIPMWSVTFTDKDGNFVNTIYEAVKGTQFASRYIKDRRTEETQ